MPSPPHRAETEAESAFVESVRSLSDRHGGITSFVFERDAMDQVLREASPHRFDGVFVVSDESVGHMPEPDRVQYCRVYVGVGDSGNEFSRRVVNKQEERKVRRLLGGLFLESATYSLFVEYARAIRIRVASFQRIWSLDEQQEHQEAQRWNRLFPFSSWVYTRADSRLTPVLYDVYYAPQDKASVMRVRAIDESSLFLYPAYDKTNGVRHEESHRRYRSALDQALNRREKAIQASQRPLFMTPVVAKSKASVPASCAPGSKSASALPIVESPDVESMNADEYVAYMEEQRLVETLDRVLCLDESKQ